MSGTVDSESCPPDVEASLRRGEVLWALDLDANRQPWRAHLIIGTVGEPFPTTYVAACGARLSTQFAGCWSTRMGEPPINPEFVHCGLAAGSNPID